MRSGTSVTLLPIPMQSATTKLLGMAMMGRLNASAQPKLCKNPPYDMATLGTQRNVMYSIFIAPGSLNDSCQMISCQHLTQIAR